MRGGDDGRRQRHRRRPRRRAGSRRRRGRRAAGSACSSCATSSGAMCCCTSSTVSPFDPERDPGDRPRRVAPASSSPARREPCWTVHSWWSSTRSTCRTPRPPRSSTPTGWPTRRSCSSARSPARGSTPCAIDSGRWSPSNAARLSNPAQDVVASSTAAPDELVVTVRPRQSFTVHARGGPGLYRVAGRDGRTLGADAAARQPRGRPPPAGPALPRRGRQGAREGRARARATTSSSGPSSSSTSRTWTTCRPTSARPSWTPRWPSSTPEELGRSTARSSDAVPPVPEAPAAAT